MCCQSSHRLTVCLFSKEAVAFHGWLAQTNSYTLMSLQHSGAMSVFHGYPGCPHHMYKVTPSATPPVNSLPFSEFYTGKFRFLPIEPQKTFKLSQLESNRNICRRTCWASQCQMSIHCCKSREVPSVTLFTGHLLQVYKKTQETQIRADIKSELRT